MSLRSQIEAGKFVVSAEVGPLKGTDTREIEEEAELLHDKVDAANASPDNTISATVEIIEPLGAEAYLYLTTGKSPFIARVSSHDQIEINQDIELVFNMQKSHIFDKETEKCLTT